MISISGLNIHGVERVSFGKITQLSETNSWYVDIKIEGDEGVYNEVKVTLFAKDRAAFAKLEPPAETHKIRDDVSEREQKIETLSEIAADLREVDERRSTLP